MFGCTLRRAGKFIFIEKEFADVLCALGWKIDVEGAVGSLSAAYKFTVAIYRALVCVEDIIRDNFSKIILTRKFELL